MGFGYGFSRNIDINFSDLYSIIRKNRWHILVSGLIASTMLMAILELVPQKYQGTTSILIDNREFTFNGSEKIVAQAAIVRSDSIILKAIQKLGLPDRALIGIKEKIKTSIDENARVLQLQFSSSDRILASMVPNAIADEYLAASQTKTVNAHVIARATSIDESRILVNALYAALSAVLAMGLYIAGILISTLISGAGLNPSGKISRELVPDAVQNLPEFAI